MKLFLLHPDIFTVLIILFVTDVDFNEELILTDSRPRRLSVTLPYASICREFWRINKRYFP